MSTQKPRIDQTSTASRVFKEAKDEACAPMYPNPPFQALVRWQPASLEKRHHQKDGERPGTCPCPLPMTSVTAASEDVGTLTDTNKREQ